MTGLLAAGCYPASQRAAAGEAARSFLAAVREGDGQRACGLLSAAAAERLRSGGQPCEQALAGLDLRPGAVERVEVWGDRAQVASTRDTLFLVRLAEGWRVAAAGCRRRAGQPYECEVEA